MTCPVAAVTSFTIRTGPNEDLILLAGVATPATVDGGFSGDTIVGGNGADTFVWSPGGHNDSIDGGPGTDTLLFNGSNASEIIAITADGLGFEVSRNVGAVALDVDDVEVLELVTQGGVDDVTTTALLRTTQHLTAGVDSSGRRTPCASIAGGVCLDQQGDAFEVRGARPSSSPTSTPCSRTTSSAVSIRATAPSPASAVP